MSKNDDKNEIMCEAQKGREKWLRNTKQKDIDETVLKQFRNLELDTERREHNDEEEKSVMMKMEWRWSHERKNDEE